MNRVKPCASSARIEFSHSTDAQTCSTSFAEISTKLVEQVCASVLWENSMRALLAQGYTRFIELGPGTALSGFMKRIDKTATMLNVADAASLEATVKTLSV